jgi:hypothetical protein
MTYVITIAAGALPAGAAGISLTTCGGEYQAAANSERWPF